MEVLDAKSVMGVENVKWELKPVILAMDLDCLIQTLTIQPFLEVKDVKLVMVVGSVLINKLKVSN